GRSDDRGQVESPLACGGILQLPGQRRGRVPRLHGGDRSGIGILLRRTEESRLHGEEHTEEERHGCNLRRAPGRSDRSTSCSAPLFSSFSFPRPDFSSASPSTSAKRAPKASARFIWLPGLLRRNDTSAGIPALRSSSASASARASSSGPSGAKNTSGRTASSRPA